jgi:hypothetical protein
MAESIFTERPADFQFEDGIETGDLDTVSIAAPAATVATGPDLGPCLYLGPAGQRCYRRAVKDGFCAIHQPGPSARPNVAKRSKIVAAIVGVLGALWPYIYDFIHQLMRLMHPR